MTSIQEKLFSLQDKKYKEFSSKLIPTVNTDLIIGVRTPDLRNLAKQLSNTQEANDFLEQLPHHYTEEYNLHGLLIERIKDFDVAVAYLDKFLPYVDNWATCDIVSPKGFKKHTPELLPKIKEWINSDKTYTIRFGIEMLMSFYLDDEFQSEYLDLVADVKSEEYYVKMMVAWFFATALAKQYDSTLPFIQKNRLAVWTHNKTIQKAVESYRITPEQKEYLKSLKIKNS